MIETIPSEYRAFLFDLNGTMINDMEYHIHAWHRIFHELGADISVKRMKAECYGKNNELIERIFPGRFSEKDKTDMSLEKEKEYQRAFKPHLELLPGLKTFLQRTHARGIRMAIGSAAIMINIDFVLDNCGIRKYFDVLVSADDVSRSKPDPETYLECARRLNISPQHCLVFEDSPKGVESAARAGMQSVVITLLHKQDEFSQGHDIRAFVKDFHDPLLAGPAFTRT